MGHGNLTEESETRRSLFSSGKHRNHESSAGESSCIRMEDGTARGRKRKAPSEEGPPRKRFKCDSDTNSVSPCNVLEEGSRVRGSKLKVDTGGETPRKRRRVDSDPHSGSPCSVVTEGASVGGSKQRADASEETPRTETSDTVDTGSRERRTDSDGRPKTSENLKHSSVRKAQYESSFPIKTSRDEFEEMYSELYKIGEGGFGAVYSGYRKTDNIPVAIKHIQRESVSYIEVVENGKEYQIIEEVALMEKATGGAKACRKSAAIALLDCFDLEDELILVMERPVSCSDLEEYCIEGGGCLTEGHAKIILRQMVEAAMGLHSNGVFHRDIKMENVLVEAGPDGPRVRVIDFGCGCLVKNGSYDYFNGTLSLAPPEWFLQKQYQAAPTTVWQLGGLLYDLLHFRQSFDTMMYLWGRVEFNFSLSTDCKDFLALCLDTDPETRGTLEDLWGHPWLR